MINLRIGITTQRGHEVRLGDRLKGSETSLYIVKLHPELRTYYAYNEDYDRWFDLKLFVDSWKDLECYGNINFI